MAEPKGISRHQFFLGGRDLEMVTIRELLERHTPGRFYDKGLPWGAKASAYREEIEQTLKDGDAVVLVELPDDIGLPDGKVSIVDHHGGMAGINRPTSLHQIFDLLELPHEAWTRRFDLVAANDWGYIPALQKKGATMEEIAAIRRADREAQGVTAVEEQQAEEAIKRAEILADGRLTVICLPHNRTSPVSDLLRPELGGQGYENLLVICPKELDFFGSGDVVAALDRSFPGGWYGGALPERGFWGHTEPITAHVLAFIQGLLQPEIRHAGRRS